MTFVQRLLCGVLLVAGFATTASGQSAGIDETSPPTITIGSKNFTESYVLGEVLAQLFESRGYAVTRNFGMTGTMVSYQALRNGDIDVYIEYSGTVAEVILTASTPLSIEELNTQLAAFNIEALPSLGFNNTYAITMRRQQAAELGISTVSELARLNDIDIGFSVEFLNRNDGWPGLAATYGFTQQPVGMDHGLAYQAIEAGTIDITDAYSTDGDLDYYDLVILDDDLNYFPEYVAFPLINQSLDEAARELLVSLTGRIDEERMRQLNGQVLLEGKSFAEVARQFLLDENLISEAQAQAINTNQIWVNLWRNTLVHLQLTFIALFLGCLAGVPLGVVVYRSRTMSRVILYVAGLLQTIPSIALLALFIPLFGIGQTPAIVALFLYSLMPILRSTVTALLTIDSRLKRVAEALGMTRLQQLRYVLVPLALPNVLTGIKSAAIISIGTATLAAFIGAGGLGEPIVTGLALNNTGLILQGAIPAACLAILTEIAFELMERRLVKPHMLVAQLPK